jgi:hypothetical protein
LQGKKKTNLLIFLNSYLLVNTIINPKAVGDQGQMPETRACPPMQCGGSGLNRLRQNIIRVKWKDPF